MPTPVDKPFPSEPASISIPIVSISGYAVKLEFVCLNVFNNDNLKKPRLANTEYNAGEACPLDKINLSLSFQFGKQVLIFIILKYRATKISTQDNELPGCPI